MRRVRAETIVELGRVATFCFRWILAEISTILTYALCPFLLSSHFSDILGDRIAIMAEGQLRCVGSSLVRARTAVELETQQ